MRKIKKLYLNESDKESTFVGFSRDGFSYHKGTSGLKYYIVIMYLRKHMEIFGEVRFTLSDLARECGFSTSTRNSKAYDDFRLILRNWIIFPEFATTDQDVEKVRQNEIIALHFSEKKSPFFSTGKFVEFSVAEYERILRIDDKVGRPTLVGVFLYIKQFIPKYHPDRISFPSREQISEGLGISAPTIDSAIAALEGAKMLFVAREMYIENEKSPGTYVPIRNVYALEGDALSDEVLLPHLEKLYLKPIYKKDNVPGKIVYLSSKKGK